MKINKVLNWSRVALVLSVAVVVSSAHAQPSNASEKGRGRCGYKNVPPSTHPVSGYGVLTVAPEDVGVPSQFEISLDTDPDLVLNSCRDVVRLGIGSALLHQTHPLCGQARSLASDKIQGYLSGIQCTSPRGSCGHPYLTDLDSYEPGLQLIQWHPAEHCKLDVDLSVDVEIEDGVDIWICKVKQVQVIARGSGLGVCGIIAGS